MPSAGLPIQSYDIDGRLRQLIYWMHDEWNSHKVGSLQLCTCFFHSILAGRTPMQDLRAERVKYARHLIITTDLPLKDIASHAGLCDEHHHSHLIRGHLNCVARRNP